MSLLNAWVSGEEAVVAVDTDGVGEVGQRIPASKLLPIPHLNAVIAIRGQLAFLTLLHMRCLNALFDTFDQMADAMPQLLVDVERMVPAELIVQSGLAGTELVAAGWSPRRGSVTGLQCVKRGAMTEFSVADLDFHISPWDRSMAEFPRKASAVQKIALEQVRWMRRAVPGAACGGNLVLCTLTRSGMTLTNRPNFFSKERANA